MLTGWLALWQQLEATSILLLIVSNSDPSFWKLARSPPTSSNSHCCGPWNWKFVGSALQILPKRGTAFRFKFKLKASLATRAETNPPTNTRSFLLKLRLHLLHLDAATFGWFMKTVSLTLSTTSKKRKGQWQSWAFPTTRQLGSFFAFWGGGSCHCSHGNAYNCNTPHCCWWCVCIPMPVCHKTPT